MFNFNSIEEAIRDIKEGKMVIVVDDESRENEGDLDLVFLVIVKRLKKKLQIFWEYLNHIFLD